mgnify:CR=1 FL=1
MRRLPRFLDAPKGYRPGAGLHLRSVGDASTLPLDLVAASTRWTTRTPMLADRHPKIGRARGDFVAREVGRELEYRAHSGETPPAVRSVRLLADWEEAEVRAFRRYRWKESMAQRRRGFRVAIEFDRMVAGPLSLGALSHFGFGQFEVSS